MAKNSVKDWDTTAANNTDVGGIDIAEGCVPSNINNAIREMMAQVRSGFTYGSNANGEYLRFPDGTQLCWGLKATTGPISSSQDMLYFGAAQSITMPAAFTGSFSLTATARHPSIPVLTATTATQAWAFSTRSVTSATYHIFWMAIGRWY